MDLYNIQGWLIEMFLRLLESRIPLSILLAGWNSLGQHPVPSTHHAIIQCLESIAKQSSDTDL